MVLGDGTVAGMVCDSTDSVDVAAVNRSFYCITLPCRYFYKVIEMWLLTKTHITPSNSKSCSWLVNSTSQKSRTVADDAIGLIGSIGMCGIYRR